MALAMAPIGSSHTGLVLPAPIAGSSLIFREELTRKLDIPAHLTDHTDISLHHSYQKYKAYEDASTKLASMVTDKLWLGRRPSSAELIEVFIAKTRF